MENYDAIATRHDVKLITLPDKRQAYIREQNGQDESILSDLETSKDGSAARKFLARIVLGITASESETFGPLTLNMIKGLKTRSVYALLLHSRIHSLGSTMIFEKTFYDPNDKNKTKTLTLEEDLLKYLWDYCSETASFPVNPTEDDGYFKFRCQPYVAPNDEYFEFKLPSGKEVRIKYLTNELEFESLANTQNSNVNTGLLLRGIELKEAGKTSWLKLQTFDVFTSKEMALIRKAQLDHDPEFGIVTEMIHPFTGEPIQFSLIGEPDFFFPVG